MLKEAMGGFCMALADSVPGVSGGTIAFILGFYDRFIGSIDGLVFGDIEKKKRAIFYLMKLLIGWMIGMVLAVFILSSLFEQRIYGVSSLFIGFIAGSIPVILKEEQDSILQVKKGGKFCLIGLLLVVGITWINEKVGTQTMNLSQFSIGLGFQLFFIGMIAISAMFLPGISGSTLLLIFGAYIPVIKAVHSILQLDLSVFPALLFFGLGILAGAALVVRGIKYCLEKYRAQMVYLILGMMIGSFYAIIQGPTTLDIAQPAMNLGHFHLTCALIGCILVLAMQKAKERKQDVNE